MLHTTTKNYSTVFISHSANHCSNARMRVGIKNVREKNLRLLLREAGGNQAEVARRCGSAASYISQILTGTKTVYGKPRGIGDALARALEAGFEKEPGWMDTDHDVVKEDALPYSVGELSARDKALIELARETGLTERFIEIATRVMDATDELLDKE